ncbi:MAG: hypothetical protein WC308_04160 [archaeon]
MDYYQGILFPSKVLVNYGTNQLFQQIFLIAPTIVPNSAAVYIIAVLSYIVPIDLAGKLVISIFIILFPQSIIYFIGKFNPSNKWLGLFSLPFIFNQFFVLGILNYYFGIILFFFSLGIFISMKTKREMLVFSTLCIITFLTHFGAAIMLSAAIVFITLGKIIFNKDKSCIKYLFLAAPMWAMIAVFTILNKADISEIIFYSSPFEKIKNLPGTFITYSITTDFLLLLVTLMLFCIVLFKNRHLKINEIIKNPSSWVLLCMVIIWILAPEKIGTWIRADKRAIFFIPFLLLAITTIQISKKTKKIIISSLVGIAILTVFFTAQTYSEFNLNSKKYVNALEQIPDKNLLYLSSSELIGRFGIYESALNGYYGIEKNGISSNVFTSYMHPIRFSDFFKEKILSAKNVCAIYKYGIVYQKEYPSCFTQIKNSDGVIILKSSVIE